MYQQKYLKYRNKYLTLKNQISNQFGGSNDKYVLLSCPEFNSLVDDI